jgi:hypothetical protein
MILLPKRSVLIGFIHLSGLNHAVLCRLHGARSILYNHGLRRL